MNALDRQIDVVEELVMVVDRSAGAEKHHYLLVAILLQEGEQQQKALLRQTHDVALKRIATDKVRLARVQRWNAYLLKTFDRRHRFRIRLVDHADLL